MVIDAEYGGLVTAVRHGARAIAVIGAGPAGLMAAEILSAAGQRVTVYERMASPARKFLLAGRGGLNLTHSELLANFLRRYCDDAARVMHAITAFPPDALVGWANGLGAETFVGSSGRVFPKAMKASPLLRAWLKRLDAQGVVLRTRQTWLGFDTSGMPLISEGQDSPRVVACDATVLALGGASWPKLGADGTWVPILSKLGVPIASLEPSNCGVRVAWSDVLKSRAAGAPLKRIAVTLADETRRGDLVITAAGLEGGAIYALTPHLRAVLRDVATAQLSLDLKPDMTVDDLAGRIARAKPGQSLSNTLRKAASLDAAAIALVNETVCPRAPETLARHLKALPIIVTGLAGINRAISTAGGVTAEAIDQNFMLKGHPGVFVAGEMLNWDAPTGGYLLQAAFATGHAAAQGVLQWLEVETKSGQN